MLNFHSHKPARLCDGLTRRDFLRVGDLGTLLPGPNRRLLPLVDAAPIAELF
jgi:hypothetical protein